VAEAGSRAGADHELPAPADGAAIAAPASPRYVVYLGFALLLLGLFERSELLPVPAGLAAFTAGVLVVALLGLLAAFRQAGAGSAQALRPQHYLVPALAVLTAAAISYEAPDWRLHALSQLAMGAAVATSGYVTLEGVIGRVRPGQEFLHDAAVIIVLLGAYLAILNGVPGIAGRVALVALVAFLAAYESFNEAVPGDLRAALFGLIVAQVVGTLGFALISFQSIDAGRMAAVLLIAWYANRGIGYNLLKNSLTGGIFVEYAVAAVLCAGLVVSALMTR
jgi:hypothetical protein